MHKYAYLYEIMIADRIMEDLRKTRLSKSLLKGFPEEYNAFAENHISVIENSMNAFADTELAFDSTDFKDFNRACKLWKDSYSKDNAEEHYTGLLEALDIFTTLEYRCKEKCCEDWNRELFLTPNTCTARIAKDRKDQSVIVHFINPESPETTGCVSCSLVNTHFTEAYQNRKIGLVMGMTPRTLIAMSEYDSSTSTTSWEPDFIDAFPFVTENAILTSTFQACDAFKPFRNYIRRDRTGEILLTEGAPKLAVIYLHDASEKQQEWARCYAKVFGLPLYSFRPADGFIKLR